MTVRFSLDPHTTLRAVLAAGGLRQPRSRQSWRSTMFGSASPPTWRSPSNTASAVATCQFPQRWSCRPFGMPVRDFWSSGQSTCWRWSGSARFTTTLSSACWSPRRLPNRSR